LFLFLGFAPPSKRDESQFDAGSKFHVAANVEYVQVNKILSLIFDKTNLMTLSKNIPLFQYFTAHIYEFQFYQALCKVSGQYVPDDSTKPLHRCNFYGESQING
jgi:peptidyl-dipeptidase A